MTKANNPCLKNHPSALASDSGLKYFCSQRDCAVRRPKLEPRPYNPISPTQIPRNVVRSPIRGSKLPLSGRVAASRCHAIFVNEVAKKMESASAACVSGSDERNMIRLP